MYKFRHLILPLLILGAMAGLGWGYHALTRVDASPTPAPAPSPTARPEFSLVDGSDSTGRLSRVRVIFYDPPAPDQEPQRRGQLRARSLQFAEDSQVAKMEGPELEYVSAQPDRQNRTVSYRLTAPLGEILYGTGPFRVKRASFRGERAGEMAVLIRSSDHSTIRVETLDYDHERGLAVAAGAVVGQNFYNNPRFLLEGRDLELNLRRDRLDLAGGATIAIGQLTVDSGQERRARLVMSGGGPCRLDQRQKTIQLLAGPDGRARLLSEELDVEADEIFLDLSDPPAGAEADPRQIWYATVRGLDAKGRVLARFVPEAKAASPAPAGEDPAATLLSTPWRLECRLLRARFRPPADGAGAQAAERPELQIVRAEGGVAAAQLEVAEPIQLRGERLVYERERARLTLDGQAQAQALFVKGENRLRANSFLILTRKGLIRASEAVTGRLLPVRAGQESTGEPWDIDTGAFTIKLKRDEQGRLPLNEIESAQAGSPVRLVSGARQINGEELRVDQEQGLIVVTGSPADISDGGATMTAPEINIHQAENRAVLTGGAEARLPARDAPGDFWHLAGREMRLWWEEDAAGQSALRRLEAEHDVELIVESRELHGQGRFLEWDEGGNLFRLHGDAGRPAVLVTNRISLTAPQFNLQDQLRQLER